MADSIAIDLHKMLYSPYASGAILFKERQVQKLIEKDMIENGRYLIHDESVRNYGTSRVEGSMGAAGVISAWATIKLFGRDGLRAILDHTIDLTNHAYDSVMESNVLRPLHRPETNTLLIGLRETGFSAKIYNRIVETVQKRVDEETGYYMSFNGDVDRSCGRDRRGCFRFVAMHPFTTEDEVDNLLRIFSLEATKEINKAKECFRQTHIALFLGIRLGLILLKNNAVNHYTNYSRV